MTLKPDLQSSSSWLDLFIPSRVCDAPRLTGSKSHRSVSTSAQKPVPKSHGLKISPPWFSHTQFSFAVHKLSPHIVHQNSRINCKTVRSGFFAQIYLCALIVPLKMIQFPEYKSSTCLFLDVSQKQKQQFRVCFSIYVHVFFPTASFTFPLSQHSVSFYIYQRNTLFHRLGAFLLCSRKRDVCSALHSFMKALSHKTHSHLFWVHQVGYVVLVEERNGMVVGKLLTCSCCCYRTSNWSSSSNDDNYTLILK